MGHGPGPAPLVSGAPEPLAVEFEAARPSFDTEAAGALVDGIIEALNDFAAAFQRNAAMRWLGDEALAESAAKAARMSEKVQATVKAGAVACFEKYAVSMEYAPETTLAVGLGLWGLGNYYAYKKVCQQGQKLRAEKPA
jgi:hypothetical protein